MRNNANPRNKRIIPAHTRPAVDRACSARKPCVRCSMIKVIQFRFKAFRKAFGRDPLPNEPLFFAEDCTSPVPATRDQMVRQLTRAAEAAMVTVPPLLNLLELD